MSRAVHIIGQTRPGGAFPPSSQPLAAGVYPSPQPGLAGRLSAPAPPPAPPPVLPPPSDRFDLELPIDPDQPADGNGELGNGLPGGEASRVGNGATDESGAGDDGDYSTYSGEASGGLSVSASEGEEAAGELTIQQPQDSEPLRAFVTRTSSFTKEDFDELLRAPGMFAVKDHLLQDGSTVVKAGVASGRATRLMQQPTQQKLRRRRRRRRQKSVFGLPTVRPDNEWYTLWSTLILLLDLTYSAFVVPISIGMMTSFFEANWTSIFDYSAGGFFCADLLLNFHVGFIATYNMHKVLVLNGRLIAKFYMRKGSFLSDLASTVAWLGQIVLIILFHSLPNGFNPNTALFIMEGIRLLRFLRVIRLIKSLLQSCIYAAISFESKYLKFLKGQNFFSIIYIVYVILVLVNFIGCLWNFIAAIASYEETWVNYYPPFVRRYGDPVLGYVTSDEAKAYIPDIYLYFAGCYWALTTITGVGYGDIVAASLLETLVTLGVQIVGVMFFGLLLSTISELLQQANRSARRVNTFRSKMQVVEAWIDQLSLPRRLRRKIKTFYAEVWLRQTEKQEETHLYLELPHALRNEVSWHVNQRIFRSVPMLKEVDDTSLYLMASKMVPFRFGPGTDLCTEGDAADRLWVLLEGEVAALYHFNEAEHIEGPAVIGDLVMLQELEPQFSVFPCTYRTVTSCSVWMIEWRDLKTLLAYRPDLQQSIADYVRGQLAERVVAYPHVWAPKLARMSSSLMMARQGSHPPPSVGAGAEEQAPGRSASGSELAGGLGPEGSAILEPLGGSGTDLSALEAQREMPSSAQQRPGSASGGNTPLDRSGHGDSAYLAAQQAQQAPQYSAQQQRLEQQQQQQQQSSGAALVLLPPGPPSLHRESGGSSLLETVHEGVPLTAPSLGGLRYHHQHARTMPAALGRQVRAELQRELGAPQQAQQAQQAGSALAGGTAVVAAMPQLVPPSGELPPMSTAAASVAASAGSATQAGGAAQVPIGDEEEETEGLATSKVSGPLGQKLLAELQRQLAASQQAQQAPAGEPPAGEQQQQQQSTAGGAATGEAAAEALLAQPAASSFSFDHSLMMPATLGQHVRSDGQQEPAAQQQQQQQQLGGTRGAAGLPPRASRSLPPAGRSAPDHSTTMPAAVGQRVHSDLQKELAAQRQQGTGGSAGGLPPRPRAPLSLRAHTARNLNVRDGVPREHFNTMPAAVGQRMQAQLQRELAHGTGAQQEGQQQQHREGGPAAIRVSPLGVPLGMESWVWSGSQPGTPREPPALALRHPFEEFRHPESPRRQPRPPHPEQQQQQQGEQRPRQQAAPQAEPPPPRQQGFGAAAGEAAVAGAAAMAEALAPVMQELQSLRQLGPMVERLMQALLDREPQGTQGPGGET